MFLQPIGRRARGQLLYGLSYACFISFPVTVALFSSVYKLYAISTPHTLRVKKQYHKYNDYDFNIIRFTPFNNCQQITQFFKSTVLHALFLLVNIVVVNLFDSCFLFERCILKLIICLSQVFFQQTLFSNPRIIVAGITGWNGEHLHPLLYPLLPLLALYKGRTTSERQMLLESFSFFLSAYSPHPSSTTCHPFLPQCSDKIYLCTASEANVVHIMDENVQCSRLRVDQRGVLLTIK